MGAAARRRFLSVVDPRLPVMSLLPGQRSDLKPEPAVSRQILQLEVIGAAGRIEDFLAIVCRAAISGCQLGR
jgi:hypothetical protein